MKREFFVKKIPLILLFVFVFLVLLGFIIMALWNNILVPVLHISSINFWQALGIFLFSKILFGGFHGPWRGRLRNNWKERMKEKWNKMTPEEQEKFKQDWRSRCGSWGKPSPSETPAAE
jgi:hypothetical protein